MFVEMRERHPGRDRDRELKHRQRTACIGSFEQKAYAYSANLNSLRFHRWLRSVIAAAGEVLDLTFAIGGL